MRLRILKGLEKILGGAMLCMFIGGIAGLALEDKRPTIYLELAGIISGISLLRVYDKMKEKIEGGLNNYQGQDN